jgi:hypothetical protein
MQADSEWERVRKPNPFLEMREGEPLRLRRKAKMLAEDRVEIGKREYLGA